MVLQGDLQGILFQKGEEPGLPLYTDLVFDLNPSTYQLCEPGCVSVLLWASVCLQFMMSRELTQWTYAEHLLDSRNPSTWHPLAQMLKWPRERGPSLASRCRESGWTSRSSTLWCPCKRSHREHGISSTKFLLTVAFQWIIQGLVLAAVVFLERVPNQHPVIDENIANNKCFSLPWIPILHSFNNRGHYYCWSTRDATRQTQGPLESCFLSSGQRPFCKELLWVLRF